MLHAAAVLAASMGIVGCSAGPVRIEGGKAALPEGEGSAGFFDRVSGQKTVSENDAMRAMLLLLEDKDTAKTFQQRVGALMARKIVGPRWDYDAQRPLTKGKLAYMICQACNIKGGITLRLTGPSQRYCLRELQYRGLITPSIITTEVTGMEFVAVLTRADAHRQTGDVPDLLKVPAGGT